MACAIIWYVLRRISKVLLQKGGVQNVQND